ncbi:MAG TPA: uroporphyrinogen-III synthase [Puia sp.]|nr:uroporphyrinogen-III synthase [Puia sp.]
MNENKTRILCTRPVDAALVERAASLGIILESLSFIDTQAMVDEETGARIMELSGKPIVAAFTSMNAVEAVAGALKGTGLEAASKDPAAVAQKGYAASGDKVQDARKVGNGPEVRWKIFCIGSATRRLAAEYFGGDRIAGTAGSARELADTILGDPAVGELSFFCGDQRRDELPDRLRQAGLRVEEIVVYHTTQTPHKVGTDYGAVIFFSPSAVHSFFSDNTLPAGTLSFAIGQTTAEAIRQYPENNVIVSGSPDKEALVLQAIEYFQHNQPSSEQKNL